MCSSDLVEFAVSLGAEGRPAEAALLELRPLSGVGYEEVDLAPLEARDDVFCRGTALGNGVIEGLRDVVYLHPDRLKLSTTRRLVGVIEKLNHRLNKENRPYLLIGPGRWGTSDPWMGIPVVWSQVSGARAIVELELPNSGVEPSLGTHFFHNLATLRVGYFCLNAKGGHPIDLAWLEQLPPVSETLGIRHVVLPHPLTVHLDGARGQGLILRGAAG